MRSWVWREQSCPWLGESWGQGWPWVGRGSGRAGVGMWELMCCWGSQWLSEGVGGA